MTEGTQRSTPDLGELAHASRAAELNVIGIARVMADGVEGMMPWLVAALKTMDNAREAELAALRAEVVENVRRVQELELKVREES